MIVLIVEDDDFKRHWITDATREVLPLALITTARSVNGGLSAIDDRRPDILILDMSLTTFDVSADETGGRPQNFGGLEILRHLDRLDIKLPTVIVTQYNKFDRGSQQISIKALSKDLFREFPGFVTGVVYYNAAQGRWKLPFARLLRQLSSRVRA